MKRTWRNLLYTAWDVFWIEGCRIFYTCRTRFSLFFQGAVVGRNFTAIGPCHIKLRQEGSLKMGDNVTFLSYWRSNRVGLGGGVILQTFGEGRIEIGDGSGGSSVVLSARRLIRIGKNVKLGGNVRIFDHDFHSLDCAVRRSERDSQNVACKEVVLGDDVFVGAESVILKGVSLGDRVIVGAGSVVTKSFPSDSVIGGNPAKVVRGPAQENAG